MERQKQIIDNKPYMCYKDNENIIKHVKDSWIYKSCNKNSETGMFANCKDYTFTDDEMTDKKPAKGKIEQRCLRSDNIELVPLDLSSELEGGSKKYMHKYAKYKTKYLQSK